MKHIPIDFYDPENLDFDFQPELFVLQQHTPLIFTVRGLRYFSKRFQVIGIEVATLTTQRLFQQALMQWTGYEMQKLFETVQVKASATHQPNAHQVLLATLLGDIDAAELAMDRLEHASRSGLQLVTLGSPSP